MTITAQYKHVAELIASAQYDALRALTILKPQRFNWAEEVFERIHVHETPGATALIWTDGTTEKHFSFQMLHDECNQLLNLLRSHHIKQQDVIFAQMPLLPENWLTVLASVKGGFRLVPAATILGVQDIVYRFGRLLPKVVIADHENAPKIDEAEVLSGNTITLKIIIGAHRPGWVSIQQIKLQPVTAHAAATAADDPLFLFFTSGTTGMPKVVTHTHFSYPFGHLTTASWIGLRKGDVHYNISQPGWAKFAWSSFFAPWSIGATIFAFNPPGRFVAAAHLAAMEKYKVSTFCAPPTALRMLILEKLTAYHFSLRECVAAGEPLNPEIVELWKKGTGITIRDGYGQTESTCLVANMPGSRVKYGSMGKPAFLYDIVIADDDGNILPANEEGNIAVQTGTGKPNGLFSGYFGDTAKQQEVFKHQLYYTGDKAYTDQDGYIWFIGRDDDVIKSSDYRIGPFEVESVLLEHEAIVESAVVGSPHAAKGFLVKAFIVLGDQYTASAQLAEDIFAFARKNIAAYKMPRIIEFVAHLPKTISGKIRRVELRGIEAERKLQQQVIDNEFYFNTGK